MSKMKKMNESNGSFSGLPSIIDLVERFSKKCNQSPAVNSLSRNIETVNIECELSPAKNELSPMNTASSKIFVNNKGSNAAISVTSCDKNVVLKSNEIYYANNLDAVRKDEKFRFKTIQEENIGSADNSKKTTSAENKRFNTAVSFTSCDKNEVLKISEIGYANNLSAIKKDVKIHLKNMQEGNIGSADDIKGRSRMNKKAIRVAYRSKPFKTYGKAKINCPSSRLATSNSPSLRNGKAKKKPRYHNKQIKKSSHNETYVNAKQSMEYDCEKHVTSPLKEVGAASFKNDSLDFQKCIDESLKPKNKCILKCFEDSYNFFAINPSLAALPVNKFCDYPEITYSLSKYLEGLGEENLDGRKTSDWYEFPIHFENEKILSLVPDFVQDATKCLFAGMSTSMINLSYSQLMDLVEKNLSVKEYMIMKRLFKNKDGLLKATDITSRLSFVAVLVIFDEYKNQVNIKVD